MLAFLQLSNLYVECKLKFSSARYLIDWVKVMKKSGEFPRIIVLGWIA